MIRILTAFASAAILAAAPLPAVAQQAAPVPQLTLDQRMLLRCSAAFAMVAEGQANGNAAALAWPAMAERGREFFVRASAQVMEEASLDREQISAALSAEAQDIWDDGTIDEVMAACLPLLPPE